MPTLGIGELLVILVIVLVLFGAGKLADVGGALGKGIREFRKATKDATDTVTEIQDDLNHDERKASSSSTTNSSES